MRRILLVAIMILLFAGCSPEVGSDEWCANMKQKPNGDWTQTETIEYAKNCIIKFGGKDDS